MKIRYEMREHTNMEDEPNEFNKFMDQIFMTILDPFMKPGLNATREGQGALPSLGGSKGHSCSAVTNDNSSRTTV